jgi:hypothetical protein
MPKTKVVRVIVNSRDEYFSDIPIDKFTLKDFKDIYDTMDRFLYKFEYYDDALG